MTKDRIRQLAALIPRNDDYFLNAVTDTSTTVQYQTVARDDMATNDPQFGWNFVMAIKRQGMPIPTCVHEDYIIRAYRFEMGRSPRDYDIMEAVSPTLIGNWFRMAVLKAALLTTATYKEIAEAVGYSEETIRAFEQLFFNIRDRRNDRMYIGKWTFEEGVMCEHKQNYLQDTSPGVVLMRCATRASLSSVLTMAGLTPGASLMAEASDAAARVENSIMREAAALTDWGLGKQRSVAMSNAKGLITAAKASGQVAKTDETIGVSSFGGALLDEIAATAPGVIQEISDVKEQMELERRAKGIRDNKTLLDVGTGDKSI